MHFQDVREITVFRLSLHLSNAVPLLTSIWFRQYPPLRVYETFPNAFLQPPLFCDRLVSAVVRQAKLDGVYGRLDHNVSRPHGSRNVIIITP